MNGDHRGTIRSFIGIAPLSHRGQNRPQVTTLVGQAIVESRRVIAVGHLGQDSGVYESVETLIQDVARDPKALLGLVEAGHSQKDIPEYQ
jgi:hypothetical protein